MVYAVADGSAKYSTGLIRFKACGYFAIDSRRSSLTSSDDNALLYILTSSTRQLHGFDVVSDSIAIVALPVCEAAEANRPAIYTRLHTIHIYFSTIAA